MTPAEVVSERIRMLRTDRGLTQADLSGRLAQQGSPIHQTSISKMEKNVTSITVDSLAAIAQALGVPLVRMFDLGDEYLDSSITDAAAVLRQAITDFEQVADSVAAARNAEEVE